MTFSEKIIDFLTHLESPQNLPKNILAMNPIKENQQTLGIAEKFYHKYYNDRRKRKLILGINPGRFGGGITGIPFTDTKRLLEFCNIKVEHRQSHEPSSVFIYDVIQQYGGVEKFYRDFYISSISPLGFIRLNDKNNWVNYNYYDSKELMHSLMDFMIASLKKQLDFGIDREVCFVLGKKNHDFVHQINKQEKFFKKLKVLNHPRYIVQYKSSMQQDYIDEYIKLLSS